MKQLTYQVRFTTPAFLGNAEQNGQWRTPPFKALLRQWWRVAYAADKKFQINLAEMRREEGLLFGHAWLDDDRDERGREIAARKSQVRIRLKRWDLGTLKSWQGLEQAPVVHPEAERVNYRVGPHAYLGFGPLDGRGGTRLSKSNALIQAKEQAEIIVAMPDPQGGGLVSSILKNNTSRIHRALWLMDRYGTLGGRSRNGWGSFCLQPIPPGPGWDEGLKAVQQVPCRDWQLALGMDWPHAIGESEQRALIWETEQAYGDWKALMRDLAILKIGIRTQFVFSTGNNAPGPEARHWLSHPVTQHNVRAWRQGRLPNSLRFKVRPDAKDPAKLRGVIFHVPCLPPCGFAPDLAAVKQTWKSVHALLDQMTKPPGQRTYGSVTDPDRRAKLQPQLNSVTLQRISE